MGNFPYNLSIFLDKDDRAIEKSRYLEPRYREPLQYTKNCIVKHFKTKNRHQIDRLNLYEVQLELFG